MRATKQRRYSVTITNKKARKINKQKNSTRTVTLQDREQGFEADRVQASLRNNSYV